MTMHKMTGKLRRYDIQNYYLLIFCTFLSVVLVSSFAFMYLSPTVQQILPSGGDSRKQAVMIFAIAVTGCALFTTYASSLFLRCKSREFGIFMALGMKKKELKNSLYRELSLLLIGSSLLGLLMGLPVSYAVWKLFQLFIVDTKEMQYQLAPDGFLYGIAYCLLVTLCIFLSAEKFIRKSYVISMIQKQNQSETIKDCKPWVGILGWIFSVLGIVLGYLVPEYSVRALNYYLPSLWSLTYLFSLAGIYLIMFHAVIHRPKGRCLKRYYKNIVSTNMMRFSGRQTIKNMCVLAFLTAGALFAVFYLPVTIVTAYVSAASTPIDYSLYYQETERQIDRGGIYALAQEYGITMTSYEELESLSLIVNGTETSYSGPSGRSVKYQAINKSGYDAFFSESDFNRVSGRNLVLKPGTYKTLVSDRNGTDTYGTNDSLRLLTHPVSDLSEVMEYAGIEEYQPLTRNFSTKHVISDEDYARLSKDLPSCNKERFILFNVEDCDSSYAFAKALKKELIERSSPESAVDYGFDAYEKQRAHEKGEEYYLDSPSFYEEHPITLSGDNTSLFQNWKYYPAFRVLDKQDMIKNTAVFLMLFAYIAIICFAAVAIIAYTRSVTIGLHNKELFSDLQRLGAARSYCNCIIKKQLKKIFFYPAAIGGGIMYLFFFLILFFNDNYLSAGETYAVLINLFLLGAAACFFYFVYRLSFSKIKKIVYR